MTDNNVTVSESVTLADHPSETVIEICLIAEAMALSDSTDGNWWRDHARFMTPAPRRRRNPKA
jgi:hypothetical protein